MILLTVLFASFSCDRITAGRKSAQVERTIDAMVSELSAKLGVDFAKNGLLTKLPPVSSFEYDGDKYSFEGDHKNKLGGLLAWKARTSEFVLGYINVPDGSGKTEAVTAFLRFSLPKSYRDMSASKPYLHVLDGQLVLNKTTRSEVDKMFGKPGRLRDNTGLVGPSHIRTTYIYYNPRDESRELWLEFNEKGILVYATLMLSYTSAEPEEAK